MVIVCMSCLLQSQDKALLGSWLGSKTENIQTNRTRGKTKLGRSECCGGQDSSALISG